MDSKINPRAERKAYIGEMIERHVARLLDRRQGGRDLSEARGDSIQFGFGFFHNRPRCPAHRIYGLLDLAHGVDQAGLVIVFLPLLQVTRSGKVRILVLIIWSLVE